MLIKGDTRSLDNGSLQGDYRLDGTKPFNRKPGT